MTETSETTAGKVFVVANQKGGTGKSNICMNLAGAFCEDDAELKVLVVDADAQNTSIRWSSISNHPLPFKVISLAATGKSLGREIRRHAGDYDLILVDCPPSIHDPNTEAAVRVADFVLIPLDASPSDAWSTVGMLTMVTRVIPVAAENHCAVVFNKTDSRKVAYRETRRALEEVGGVTILNTVLKTRECYKICTGAGTTVFDAKGIRGAKEAAEEIRNLASEIISLIQN